MMESLNDFKENIIGNVSGLIAFSVTEIETGACFVSHTNNPDFEIKTEASYNLDILKAKVKFARALNLEQRILDITTTFENQAHIINVSEDANYYVYLVIDLTEGDLLLAKSMINEYKKELNLAF